MKKGLIIVAALGLLAVVSCKKDHTCNCTFTSSGGAFGDFSMENLQFSDPHLHKI